MQIKRKGDKVTVVAKRSRKQKSALSKVQAKAVARIAKKVSMKEAETKVGYFNISTSFKHTMTISWNLMYQAGFANGTGGEDSAIVGDSFRFRGIRVRGLLNSGNIATNRNGHKSVTLAIIATDKYTTVASLSNNDYIALYGLAKYPPRISTDLCKVIHKEVYELQPQVLDNSTTATVDFFVDMKDKLTTFRNIAGDWQLKDHNYYLVLYAGQWGILPNDEIIGGFDGQVDLFYKDS